jgi:hypothetical protein
MLELFGNREGSRYELPHVEPFYVIGERSIGRNLAKGNLFRATRLLLWSAVEPKKVNDNPLKAVNIDTSKWEAVKSRPMTPFTPSEVADLFNPATKTFGLAYRQSGSISRLDIYNSPIEDTGTYGIPDDVLARFDVLHHLNQLAVIFGKQPEYSSLLSREASLMTQTPIAALEQEIITPES